jgi:hypothetical protein
MLQEFHIPYIQFITRPEEDRNKTIEQGRMVYKDVIYAVITPSGRKDVIEKNAEEWISDLRLKAMKRDNSRASLDNNYPMEVVERFEKMLKMYKEDNLLDMPLNGASIKTADWLTPAQKQNCLSVNIRTVEDLANATEEGLANLGMGARDLREKARNALKSAEGGKVALEMDALQKENDNLKKRLEKLEAAANKPKKRVKEDA